MGVQRSRVADVARGKKNVRVFNVVPCLRAAAWPDRIAANAA